MPKHNYYPPQLSERIARLEHQFILQNNNSLINIKLQTAFPDLTVDYITKLRKTKLYKEQLEELRSITSRNQASSTSFDAPDFSQSKSKNNSIVKSTTAAQNEKNLSVQKFVKNSNVQPSKTKITSCSEINLCENSNNLQNFSNYSNNTNLTITSSTSTKSTSKIQEPPQKEPSMLAKTLSWLLASKPKSQSEDAANNDDTESETESEDAVNDEECQIVTYISGHRTAPSKGRKSTAAGPVPQTKPKTSTKQPPVALPATKPHPKSAESPEVGLAAKDPALSQGLKPAPTSSSAHNPIVNADAPATVSTLRHTCPNCGMDYTTASGLSIHRKKSHPVEYNADKQATLSTRTQIDDEDLVMIARLECDFLKDNIHGNRTTWIASKSGLQEWRVRNIRQRPGYTAVLAAEQAELLKVAPNREFTTTDNSVTEAEPLEQFLRRVRPTCSPKCQQLVDHINSDDEQAARQLIIELCQATPAADKDIEHQKKAKKEDKFKSEKAIQKRDRFYNVQNGWQHRQRETAQRILAGKLTAPQEHVDRDELAAYWRSVFETESVADTRPAIKVQSDWTFKWLSVANISSQLAKCRASASGPDGTTLAQIRAKHQAADLAVIFNYCLDRAWSPPEWSRNRTILIPKRDQPAAAGDYRPITIGSWWKRLFHRALLHAIEPSIMLNNSQRGFAKTDGSMTNSHLLNASLQISRSEGRPLHLCLLDISKAFDSTSHESIIRAMRNHGVPGKICSYIEAVYRAQSTTIYDYDCKINRGVLQGDPLSPLLFNMVIDEALDALKAPGLSFNPKTRQPALAFADDIVLMSNSKDALQLNISTLAEKIKQCGLTINPAKTKTLSIVKEPRQSGMVVIDGKFQIDGEHLPSVGVQEVFEYLGIPYDHTGRIKNTTGYLVEMLDKASKAPLKPLQKLHLLRTYLIPKLVHRLVMGATTCAVLRRCDRLIRHHVRKWLHCPAWTPIAYLHAKLRDGGLGVHNLQQWIPILKASRVEQMLQQHDPAIAAIVSDKYTRTLMKEVSLFKCEGRRLSKMEHVDAYWAHRLHHSVDGAGLLHFADQSKTSDWVAGPDRRLAGWQQVALVKTRCGLLPTREQANRGNDHTITCSAGCQGVENINHVIQNCPRSHEARLRRHDHLRRLLKKALERVGNTVVEEKYLAVQGRKVKPDLVFKDKEDRVHILDVQVRQCTRNLNLLNREKISLYNTAEIKQAAADAMEGKPGQVFAATLNFKGVWAHDSVLALQKLRVPLRALRDCVVACLLGSYECYRQFGKSNLRARCRAPPAKKNVRFVGV